VNDEDGHYNARLEILDIEFGLKRLVEWDAKRIVKRECSEILENDIEYEWDAMELERLLLKFDYRSV
jgi:hypothetical protein